MPDYNVAIIRGNTNEMEPAELNAYLTEKIQKGRFTCITPVPTTKEAAMTIALLNNGIIIEYETQSEGKGLITGFYPQNQDQPVPIEPKIEVVLSENNLIDPISIARALKAKKGPSEDRASNSEAEPKVATNTITQRFKKWLRELKSSAPSLDINDPDQGNNHDNGDPSDKSGPK